ncbi:uncharacterized protein YktB (UPF0637 family) [Salibacterium salarium]|uniref:UPF0637 protein D7Z54_22535 n=1 Tax=Salibacterium salarium TaxID=284579 RepID=A0A3R9QID8_9BACI|nr:DUF1054 domain-containing protein [Salibacterium salarium]MDQ0298977.1 uncharacterized protein YktB (UPF0637 family) [Salibacterium salarium]RSL31096.1 DUF1054 domain-containing protein [Salibacterium salarium]
MPFQGFRPSDFETFYIDELDERMEAIRNRIQPKFKSIGEYLTDELSVMLGKEMYLHIAKHARRTKNPPTDTWLGIADDKRGYKKHPHFQVGLFDDHVFLWLAYIYEMPNKTEVAKTFLENQEKLESLPKDYVISLDHTKKDAFSIKKSDSDEITEALQRFRDVKKGEFLIGKHIDKNDPVLENGQEFLQEAKKTFETLLPFYQMSLHQE